MTTQTTTAASSRQQRWLIGVGLLSACLISAFFLTLSWLAGGDAFMRTLNGHEALVLALVGAGVGAALALANREQTGSSPQSVSANKQNTVHA